MPLLDQVLRKDDFMNQFDDDSASNVILSVQPMMYVFEYFNLFYLVKLQKKSFVRILTQYFLEFLEIIRVKL